MIYLEPRSTYDKAIIQHAPQVVYDFEKLIEVLCEDLNCDWYEAVDFYCYNIEPLKYQGLLVKDD
tara:strand:- start:624 stop:818 length:195 start_codon:yes stop_codon:yes gene_type:complete